MTELDLSPEELALLELDETPAADSEEQVTPKKRVARKGKTSESEGETPVGDELSPVPAVEPEPEEPREQQPETDVAPARTMEVKPGIDDKAPDAGHPLAMPAQHGWDDPWGQLPAQMRHDIHGRPSH